MYADLVLPYVILNDDTHLLGATSTPNISLLTHGQYTPSGLMSSQHTFLHCKHYPLDRRAPRGCATLALSSTGRQVLLCQVAGQALWW